MLSLSQHTADRYVCMPQRRGSQPNYSLSNSFWLYVCESTVCVSYRSIWDHVLTVDIPLCEFSMSTFTFGMFDFLNHKARYLFLYYLTSGLQTWTVSEEILWVYISHGGVRRKRIAGNEQSWDRQVTSIIYGPKEPTHAESRPGR